MDFETLIAELAAAYDPENPESLAEAVNQIPVDVLGEVRAELAALITSLNTTVQAGEGTRDDVDAIREARHYLDAVDGRLAAEDEARATMVAEAAALAEGVVTESGDDEEGDEETTPEVEPGSEDEAEGDEDTEEEVTASARPLPRPGSLAGRRPRHQEPEPDSGLVPILAAGDVDGFRPNYNFQTPQELAEALQNTATATKGGKDGRRYVVARLQHEYDIELGADGMENFNALHALQNKLALDPTLDPITAAGGFCAPEEAMYGFFNIAQADGILRLPTVGASRGKIGVPTSPSIDDLYSNADWDAAVGDQWTEAEDIAVEADDDTTWKNCYFVPCDVAASFQVTAAYTCLEFGNFNLKFWPESVANNSALSTVAHAHKVNAQQIAALLALGVTEAAVDLGDIGTIPTLLHNLEFHADEYRDKYRMGVNSRLNLYLPFWVLSAIFNDYVAQVAVTDFAKARGWFENELSIRGFNTQFLMDWQSIVGENDYPAFAEAVIEAPGTSVSMNEGRLDIGVTRSPEFNRQNKYQTFLESFQGVAKVGHEVRRITGIQVYPTGERGTHSGITVPAS